MFNIVLSFTECERRLNRTIYKDISKLSARRALSVRL